MVNKSASVTTDDKQARLKHLIKRMPNLPGVYKMLGKNGDILYVGKAKSLKNRVNSYFAKTIDHPKTRALVSRIHNIETIITRSETETSSASKLKSLWLHAPKGKVQRTYLFDVWPYHVHTPISDKADRLK